MSKSTATPFRIGQRIRLTAATGPVPAGTLCDVEAYPGPGIVAVTAYLPPTSEDPTRAHAFPIHAPVRSFESVRGRPFVPGDDDRRKDPVTGAVREPSAPRSAPTATAPAGLAEAITSAVAGALAGLTLPSAAPAVDEDAVRAIAEEVFADAIPVVEDRVHALETSLSALETALSTATAPVRAKVRSALTGKPSTGSPIASALSASYTPGEDRGVNVLLCSPPSLGKSYGVRTFAVSAGYDAFLEHPCSGDIDEIATLLGTAVPRPAGGFVVVDGVLTQAVRTASEGKSVLLLLDEVLRMAPVAQEWLLTFLTGVKRPDGTRAYRLRTRRPDASDALEVLECDAANLHIVGATNLGMLTPVEAFWSRWAKVRLAFTTDIARDVCAAVLRGEGITGDVDTLAALWAGVIDGSRKLVASGDLRFPADVRVLENAARLSDGTARDAARVAALALVDHCANWSADLGDTEPKSAAAVTGLAAGVTRFASES